MGSFALVQTEKPITSRQKKNRGKAVNNILTIKKACIDRPFLHYLVVIGNIYCTFLLIFVGVY